METLANKDRQCNIIVTGLAESENAESLLSDDRSEIVKIVNTLLPGNEDANDMEIERLGKIETARNPRPIRVKFKSSVTRNKICASAKLLKNKEGYRKVYVKKDTHHAIRKENARICKLVKDEKDRPENHHHHHSFNVSVPLKVGRTAPMFVLSFFLHSILLAGSALDSFQCLRSLLIVSFHVFFGLPHPRCPTTSNSVMLLIQPSFLTTCPNQRSRLYLNKVCMLLIPSFLSRESELMWSFKRTLHVHQIIARSLRCSLNKVIDIGGPTLTGIQQDSADIRAVYLPTCDV